MCIACKCVLKCSHAPNTPVNYLKLQGKRNFQVKAAGYNDFDLLIDNW